MVERFSGWKLVFPTMMMALLLGGACLLAGCPRKIHQPTLKGPEALMLLGAGATFPYPLYSKWFDAYKETAPGLSINYQSIGSGGGIKNLQAKTVDFGASDAPLSDADMKTMPAPVVQIPMVAGAVAIAYNLPKIQTGLKLSPDVLAGIFLGKITNWTDTSIKKLNPDLALPNLAITVAHRSDGSGTTNILTTYLAAVSPEWASKVGTGKAVNWPTGVGSKGNEGVAGTLKGAPGAIGYVELAYAQQNTLSVASLRNASGAFVDPSVESTTAAADAALAKITKDIRSPIVNSASAEAYPICGFTYILLYKEQTDAVKGAALVNFLYWAINDGQQYADALFYAPLPPSVVTLDQGILSTVTNQGKPIHVATTP